MTTLRRLRSPQRARRAAVRRSPIPLAVLFLSTLALLGGCAPEVQGDGEPAGTAVRDAADADAGQGGTSDGGALLATIRRAMAMADSVEDLLRPVALMRPEDEESLRRWSNDENVRVARRVGFHPADEADLRAAVEDGRLVTLEDSTEHWVLRDGVQPYVTPDTRALLERIGAAFQDRLEGMGLPRFRYEISSVLRTPAQQARLRRSNSNAAAGTSAHEFGTTVDVVYEAYPAPADLPEGVVATDRSLPAGEEAALDLVARTFLERMAARKSRELQAILGEVMREAQSRGEVLVTLERQQPVYHITATGEGG